MTAVLLARLVLAGVFAVAGIAKLADRAGTRKAVVDFGAPQRTAGALAIALPLAELTVAVLLLPASTAVVGAAGALALLAAFSLAIAAGLARGRAPDCHCFGQLHSAPAGWRTLARNAALLAIAALALAGSGTDESTSAVAWVGRLEGAELLALVVAVAAGILLAVGTVAVTSLMRSYGRVLTRLERVEEALAVAGFALDDPEPAHGLEPGTQAPWFLATDLTGGGVSRDELLATGKSLLLLFTSPHCGPCSALLPRAASWQRDHAETLTIAFATTGPAEAARAEAEEFELGLVLLDERSALAEQFQAGGTPSAVLIDGEGRIASWVASGQDEIERLVRGTIEGGGPAGAGLPVGAEVPALELPALDGTTLSLRDLRGRSTLLLFWNPDCGFCRSMHEDLLAWERTANGVTPRLVVVSSGDEEETRAEGFRSLVVMDADYAAGSALGAGGTPMAVLVDDEGRVASEVAAGAEAVLELAAGTRASATATT